MKHLRIQRHDIKLVPESARVIIRPFLPPTVEQMATIANRVMGLSEDEVDAELLALHSEFDGRHLNVESVLLEHYHLVKDNLGIAGWISAARQQLIGAQFSGEYALESAALFNPSIVAHPDQSDVPEGGLRFIMSLRATGEGHISSIEFRVGLIEARGGIRFDAVSRYVSMPEVFLNPTYHKSSFVLKLKEMGLENDCSNSIMDSLADHFTRNELVGAMEIVLDQNQTGTHEFLRTLDRIQWLADSNYELRFSPTLGLSERILFPVAPNESHGMEDARFVRFVEEDGAVMYYATYTAYNGRSILPQFIETSNFLHFRILTLNGSAVQNKGMALFPRRIAGKYAMISRQDDENLLLMFSDNLHYWENPQIILRPEQLWESIKIGNCGSPLETEAGWLLITHGVGPMRKYCIGAALLDLEDPSKVLGRLRAPLLLPEGFERDGYVPNVVYSCGSLLHADKLVLPYAMSDKATSIATVPLQALLTELLTPSD